MDSLRRISSAQADFRANDLDNNKVADFWTEDIAHLEKQGGLAIEIAKADTTRKPAIPLFGYFFRTLDADGSYKIPPEPYREDTDGKSGKVHNTSRFGVCAYPAVSTSRTIHTFIINENNTIFFKDLRGEAIAIWPSDSELKEWRRER